MPRSESERIAGTIPPVLQLERRFSFIEDNTLRANIALAFQYTTFLIAVMDREQAENTTVGASVHKNMIVYTAMIVEGCLHYCLKRYIEEKKIKENEVMRINWDTKEHKKLYRISDNEYVCGAIRYKKSQTYSEKLQFQDLNRACQKAGILTDPLFDRAEDVREKRNKIHLAGLGAIDSIYSKSDTQIVFKDAKDIIGRVEALLNKL